MDDRKEGIVLEKSIDLKKDFPPHDITEWKNLVGKKLKGGSFEEILIHNPVEDIEINPIYTKSDIENDPFLNSGPGSKPYIRGGKSFKIRKGNEWDICQRGYKSSPEGLNKRLKKDIAGGATSVFADIDLSSVNDVEDLFAGIDLRKYPVIFESGSFFVETYMLMNGFFEKSGSDFSCLKGYLNADPLGVLAEKGILNNSLEDDFRKIALLLKSNSHGNSNFRVVGVSTLPYHNSGCSAAEEIAFSLATTVEYVEKLFGFGIKPSNIFTSILYSFGIGTDFFIEISKLRAFRTLLCKISEKYGVGEDDEDYRIRGEVTGFNFSKQDPHVNILRATTAAISAIVGGVDHLTISPFDSVMREPGEFSVRIARNIQLILREESLLKDYIDPSAGSYFVESLTMELIKKSWSIFLAIEETGGMENALKSGFVKDIVDKSMKKRKEDLLNEKFIMVGVNRFKNGEKNLLKNEKRDIESDMKEKVSLNSGINNSDIKSLIKKMKRDFADGDVSFLRTGSRIFSLGANTVDIRGALHTSEKIEKLGFRLDKKRLSEEFENGDLK